MIYDIFNLFFVHHIMTYKIAVVAGSTMLQRQLSSKMINIFGWVCSPDFSRYGSVGSTQNFESGVKF